MAKKNYYAVRRGRVPGIYTTWGGKDGAQAQVAGYPEAEYKGFATREQALAWLNPQPGSTGGQADLLPEVRRALQAGDAVVYTDGGCDGNPGRGGYGVVILQGSRRTEYSAGYRLTTNNRMELMACIAGLEQLKTKTEVRLYSDSRYVVDGINKGWARRWRANRWMRGKSQRAENADLWVRLLELCDRHTVSFVWVAGHAGDALNERCDQLSTQAMQGDNLRVDEVYEANQGVQGKLF